MANIFHDQLLRYGFIEDPRAIDLGRSQSYSMADEGRITVTVDIGQELASFWIQWPHAENDLQIDYQGGTHDPKAIPALLGKMLAQLNKERHENDNSYSR